jgi:hypothetical protein
LALEQQKREIEQIHIHLLRIMSQRKAFKRPRIAAIAPQAKPSGRAQLLISPELQGWMGHKYCGDSEVVDLLLACGLVRRVRTMEVSVQPLGGEGFKVTLDCANPYVGEVKSEIARVQGTPEELQELYRVAERADGKAVREPLEEDEMVLGHSMVVTMAVKDQEPLEWQIISAGHDESVSLSEDGMVATHRDGDWSLTTTGTELTQNKSKFALTKNRHYWEVEVCNQNICVGVCKPNLNPTCVYLERKCTDGWFMDTENGTLYGNGKEGDDEAGCCKTGDRVGVLLDLNDGSLLFFKNGSQHGPGYRVGSVTGPVVHALQMGTVGDSARLLGRSTPPPLVAALDVV